MVGKESGIRYAEQTAKQKDRPANTLISLTPLYRTEENRAASARAYIYPAPPLWFAPSIERILLGDHVGSQSSAGNGEAALGWPFYLCRLCPRLYSPDNTSPMSSLIQMVCLWISRGHTACP